MQYEILENTDQIFTKETIPITINIPGPPLKFLSTDFNTEFYYSHGESAVEISLILLNASMDDLPKEDSEQHPNYSHLGLGIPVIPQKTPAEVVEEELDSNLPNEIRQEIKKIFANYPSVVSLHGWDCGTLKDHRGDPYISRYPSNASIRLPSLQLMSRGPRIDGRHNIIPNP